METEKTKKKRNKKKKNNNGQNKALDEISEDHSQASAEIKNVESQGKESDDLCLTGNGSNGLDSAILVESEKQQWLRKEASLEEMIRQLQAQKDSDSKKEATLVGAVNQLHEEINLHLQKELAYEETIKMLREENNSHIQKEANLEMKFGQLQEEKDSWVQNESQLEERISQLVDEKITWNLKKESIEDRIRHLEVEKRSLILKEDSNKVMISNLGDDIAVLRAQVVELEKTRNYLLNENRKLLENITSLQLQIKDIQSIASEQSLPELTKLASERDELSSQIESAFALVERLMEENAELVEKVSELLIQLDRHRGSYPRPLTLPPEPIIKAIETAGLPHSVAEIGHESNLNSIEIVPVREERNGVNYTSVDHFGEEPSEIVQIPLDENDVSDLELQISERIGEEEEVTSFTDAPMIGAPFRLISFVSRYVSGADLVEKNSLKV